MRPRLIAGVVGPLDHSTIGGSSEHEAERQGIQRESQPSHGRQCSAGYDSMASIVATWMSTVSATFAAYPPASTVTTGTPDARAASNTSRSRATSPAFVNASPPRRSPEYGSAPAR